MYIYIYLIIPGGIARSGEGVITLQVSTRGQDARSEAPAAGTFGTAARGVEIFTLASVKHRSRAQKLAAAAGGTAEPAGRPPKASPSARLGGLGPPPSARLGFTAPPPKPPSGVRVPTPAQGRPRAAMRANTVLIGLSPSPPGAGAQIEKGEAENWVCSKKKGEWGQGE